MTTPIEGSEGSVSPPGSSLPPGKTRYQLYRRPRWAPGPAWTGAKNLAPPGFDPRTLQPVASRYTDYITRPTCEHVQCLCWDWVMLFSVVERIKWISFLHYILFPIHYLGKAHWINLLVHPVRSFLWIRYRIVFPLLFYNRIFQQQDTEVKRPYCVVYLV
jgi:hypothetical protein